MQMATTAAANFPVRRLVVQCSGAVFRGVWWRQLQMARLPAKCRRGIRLPAGLANNLRRRLESIPFVLLSSFAFSVQIHAGKFTDRLKASATVGESRFHLKANSSRELNPLRARPWP